MNGIFVDVDFAQRAKHSQRVSGDVLLTRRIKEESRAIAVLSDGLGSGVKASVLANMTAAMALKYAASFVDVRRSAKTIMDTLPICEVRKISYSTFTIADVDEDGNARFTEHGNPPLVILRAGREVALEKIEIRLPEWQDRVISYAETTLEQGDRIIFCSDGVTQSGMEQPAMPMGWGRPAAIAYAAKAIAGEPEISSRQLANLLVDRAFDNDLRHARDDITAGVIYLRRPRRLLVLTGPPFSRQRDNELAQLVATYPGRVAIAGGTTAGIVSRILDRPITMDLSLRDPDVPPASRMQGADLITEGTITLARVAELLEQDLQRKSVRPNAASRMVQLMIESDHVDFVVGTRINEAHQDPSLPMELDLRRNIIRKLARLLESRLKETTIRFF